MDLVKFGPEAKPVKDRPTNSPRSPRSIKFEILTWGGRNWSSQ